ncbi:MAG: hypothetical protein ACTMIS_23275 [Pseudomonas putida]
MPTENRSSNTEMVSVPREPTPNMLAVGLEADGLLHKWYAMVNAAPAPHPHAEPIAWMVGTAFWWTKEEAERDAAAMGLPVVTLGPCAGLGDHERLRTELVESDLAFVRAATEAEQLRAQLAERDALLRELADAPPAAMEFRLQQKVRAALSASAEPSAPVLKRHHDVTMFQRGEAKP